MAFTSDAWAKQTLPLLQAGGRQQYRGLGRPKLRVGQFVLVWIITIAMALLPVAAMARSGSSHSHTGVLLKDHHEGNRKHFTHESAEAVQHQHAAGDEHGSGGCCQMACHAGILIEAPRLSQRMSSWIELFVTTDKLTVSGATSSIEKPPRTIA